MNGTDDEENLIDLFAREHFIAHKLLAEENSNNDKLIYAYAAMAFFKDRQGKRYELTPQEYEEAKISHSNMLKKRYENKENHPSYGSHLSEERKRKIGDINKGNQYCLGRQLSEETKMKIGASNKNPSDETRDKMSRARKGKNLGADNPNAKSVIRLSDGKIYGSKKDAAEDNCMNYGTLKDWVRKCKNFMDYRQWLQQNNLENNMC